MRVFSSSSSSERSSCFAVFSCSYPQDVPFVRLHLVLRVLQLFLGDQFFVPQPLCAHVIGLQHFHFRFPVLQVRFDTPRLRARRLQIRTQLTIVQLRQHRSGGHVCPGLRGN